MTHRQFSTLRSDIAVCAFLLCLAMLHPIAAGICSFIFFCVTGSIVGEYRKATGKALIDFRKTDPEDFDEPRRDFPTEKGTH